MTVLTKDEITEEHLERIREGAIFIYPTDTIYGIGCDATNDESVEKIRKIKQRPNDPFSILVPSKEWIQEHCEPANLDKLPGPYTLILKLKDNPLADNVTNNNKIGIRYPDHWFSKIVNSLNIPIITTSVNKAGKPNMTSLKDLNPDIEDQVEFIIYEGPKSGKPSTVIEEKKILR